LRGKLVKDCLLNFTLTTRCGIVSVNFESVARAQEQESMLSTYRSVPIGSVSSMNPICSIRYLDLVRREPAFEFGAIIEIFLDYDTQGSLR
jgi:hypothetical protein